eukprot:symbB.v1.2.040187.t1/scaffold7058.1/size13553/1
MPFPRFIIAVSLVAGGRNDQRYNSSAWIPMELFTPQDLPTHGTIAEKGNDAFSHWRHHITNGTYGKSMLRFSTRSHESAGYGGSGSSDGACHGMD